MSRASWQKLIDAVSRQALLRCRAFVNSAPVGLLDQIEGPTNVYCDNNILLFIGSKQERSQKGINTFKCPITKQENGKLMDKFAC